jgi:hypothetical protein
VGIGPAAHARHHLRAGDVLRGESVPVGDPRVEPVDFYKTTRLEVLTRAPEQAAPPPPWLRIPPALTVYRERGHGRLDSRADATRHRDDND